MTVVPDAVLPTTLVEVPDVPMLLVRPLMLLVPLSLLAVIVLPELEVTMLLDPLVRVTVLVPAPPIFAEKEPPSLMLAAQT